MVTLTDESLVIRIKDIDLKRLTIQQIRNSLKLTNRNINSLNGESLKLEKQDKELLEKELKRREHERLLQRERGIRATKERIRVYRTRE